MAKKTKKEPEKVVEKLAKELLELLGSKGKVEVSEDKDNDAIRVIIDAKDETGLLIGPRGETLHSIQTALGMMFKQDTGDWIRIIVDIGDWREKQEDHLRELAIQAAQRAKETGEPQQLYNLNPSHRRVIHLALKEEKGVESESFGEGEERYLEIKPVRKK